MCEASWLLSVLMLPAFPLPPPQNGTYLITASVLVPGFPGSCSEKKLWLNKSKQSIR